MKHFEQDQREGHRHRPRALFGQTGIVWRLHMRDNDAWVDMETDLPDELRFLSARTTSGAA